MNWIPLAQNRDRWPVVNKPSGSVKGVQFFD
jgi:hypothetical protein